MRIVKATQTSFACPSQWDAYDSDGNYWYLRYRYGAGEAVQLSSPDWKFDERENAERRLTFKGDHPLDGVISLEEFAQRAGFELADDVDTRSYGEFVADQLASYGVASDERRDERRGERPSKFSNLITGAARLLDFTGTMRSRRPDDDD